MATRPDFWLADRVGDSDEQLQHIEKRMLMEINWGLGADTNPESNIKVVRSHRYQNN